MPPRCSDGLHMVVIKHNDPAFGAFTKFSLSISYDGSMGVLHNLRENENEGRV